MPAFGSWMSSAHLTMRWTVVLGDPQVLPLLVPVALALAFAIRPWRPRRPARIVAWLAATGGAFSLLLVLAAPARDRAGARPQRWALLVDRSASATSEDARRIDDFADRLARQLAGVVSLERVPLGPVAEPTGDLRERTPITEALLGLGGFDRAILASDGHFAEDSRALEVLARRIGVPIDLPAHLPAPREALSVDRIAIDRAPDDGRGVRTGDDGRGRWTIALTNETTGSAELVVTAARAGVAEIELGRRTIPALAGRIELAGKLPRLDPGLYHLVARLASSEANADGLLAASAILSVGDPPRVLVVSENPDAELVRQLGAGPLFLDVRAPAEVPADPAALAAYRAVILAGVPPTSLPPASALALVQYVGKRGGGLVLLDARAALASPAWAASPIAELVPLAPVRAPPPTPEPAEPPPPPRAPPVRPPDKVAPALVAKPLLALVLVVDCSGSMRHDDKLALAREAAVASLERLDDRDLIGVVAFNSRPEWIVPLTEARARGAITVAIRSLRAEGETDIELALRAAGNRLVGLDCPIKHVVLVSDGHTGGVPLFKDLVTGMAARGITVTTIGVGEQFDHQLMSNIALWGKGRFFPATAKEVPRIAVEETTQAVTQARALRDRAPVEPPKPDPPMDPPVPPTPPGDPPLKPDVSTDPPPVDIERASDHARDPAPPPEARAVLELRSSLRSPVLAGVGPPFPALGDLPGAEARPGATVLLETTDGRPVLALWRHGPGRVAILAADTTGAAAGAWRDWPLVPRLLAQLVTHTLSELEPNHTSLEHRVAWSEAAAGWVVDAWVRTPSGEPCADPAALATIATGRVAGEPRALGPGWWRWALPWNPGPPPAWRLACGGREVDIVAPRPPLAAGGRDTLLRLCRGSGGEDGLVPEALLGETVHYVTREPLAPGAPAGLAAALLALAAAAWRVARVGSARRPA